MAVHVDRERLAFRYAQRRICGVSHHVVFHFECRTGFLGVQPGLEPTPFHRDARSDLRIVRYRHDVARFVVRAVYRPSEEVIVAVEFFLGVIVGEGVFG